MATYQDFHRVIKETVQVEADPQKRWTPQKVKFINHDNEFYGTFHGTQVAADFLSAKDSLFEVLRANSGSLNDVDLCSCVLYDRHGRAVDLSEIAEDIAKYRSQIQELSVRTEIDLPAKDLWLQQQIDDLVVSSEQDVKEIRRLDERINSESYSRELRDEELQSTIEQLSSDLGNRCDELGHRLEDFVDDTDKKIYDTKEELRDFTKQERHYDCKIVTTTERINKLFDYSTNVIQRSVPDGHVIINEETGDVHVGYIINLKKSEDGRIVEFCFKVYDDYKSDILTSKTYEFPRPNAPEGMEYEYAVGRGYKLVWDKNEGGTDKIKLYLRGEDPVSYYNLSCSDGTEVAKIKDFQKDSQGKLTSGNVIFEDDIAKSQLQKFKGKRFSFDEQNDSKYFEEDNISAKYNSSLKTMTLLTDIQYSKYHSLQDEGEFGRIYEGFVEYAPFSTVIESLSVRRNDSFEIDVLNASNGFLKLISDPSDYKFIQLSGDCVMLRYIKDRYAFQTYKYDRSKATKTDIKNGQLRFCVYNTTDLEQLASGKNALVLNIDFPEGDKFHFLNGDHIMENSLSSPRVFMANEILNTPWQQQTRVVISYNLTSKNLIDIVIHSKDVIYSSIYVDLGDHFVYDGSQSYIIKNSGKIKDDGGLVQFESVDSGSTKEYTVYQCEEKKGSQPQSIGLQTSLGTKRVDVGVPFPLPSNKMRGFNVLFDFTNKVVDETAVQLYNPHDDYPYVYNYNGEYAKDGRFVIHGKSNLLRFTEYRRNFFQIEDMRNVDIRSYLSSLDSRVTQNEKDIRTIYERIKGGVIYKGVVQVVDTDATDTTYLSDLFWRNGEHPDGWQPPFPELSTSDYELTCGWMFYVDSTENTESTRWYLEGDGVELEVGDYVVIRSDSVRVCDMTSSDVNIIDAIESDKIIVKELEVTEFAKVKSQFVNNLSAVTLSSDSVVSRLNVTDEVSAATAFIDNASIVNLTASGTLSIEDIGVNDLSVYRATISSLDCLGGLSVALDSLIFKDLSSASEICSYVQDQITKNRDDIDSISSDLYVKEDFFGNKGLSGKVDWLLQNERKSMEYQGWLKYVEHAYKYGSLTSYFAQTEDDAQRVLSASKFMKKGYFYRVAENQPRLSDELGNGIEFNVNDYVIFNQDTILSDTCVSSLDLIRDAKGEVEELKRQSVMLSGGNVISGYNEFVDFVRMNKLCIDFSNVYDNLSGTYLSDIMNPLEDPTVLTVAIRINDIITLAGLDVPTIDDFRRDTIEKIRQSTIKIYRCAFGEGHDPQLNTLQDVVDALDAVLPFLTLKNSTVTLRTRLDLLRRRTEDIYNYVQMLKRKLTALCCTTMENTRELSANLGSLSVDIYKNVDSENLLERGLSGKVEFLLSTGHRSMEYFGSLRTPGCLQNDISCFFAQKDHHELIDPRMFFKKGYTYRIAEKQDCLSDHFGNVIGFRKNDYVTFNDDVFLSDITISSFDIIVDFEDAIISTRERIDNLNYEISVDSGYIVDGIRQSGGLVSATTRRLVSSDVDLLSDYVQNEISLSVSDITSQHTVEGRIISSLTQENGRVKIETAEILSSYIVGLSDYVESEIEKLDVAQISKENEFIFKVWENDGRISAEARSIVDSDIAVESISQTKIKELSSDLFNISSEITTSKEKIDTLSTDLNTLSADYRNLKDTTFHKFADKPHISSFGLILTDEKHPTDDKVHDRYVMTFLSGTVVLEKI